MTKKIQKLIEKYQEIIQHQLSKEFNNALVELKDVSFNDSTRVAHYKFKIELPTYFDMEKEIDKVIEK